MSSPKSQASIDEEYELYDNEDHLNGEFMEDFREYDIAPKADSEDEDSADGTEEEMSKEDFSGIKEQMYQDKLGQLKSQLLQLREGTHPEYEKKLKKIDLSYKERLKINDIWKQLEMDCVRREFDSDKKLAARDFEEKKTELKENLLLDLEEKKKIIELERHSLELTGDSMEYKPVSTRKLRRRGNEPPPLVEKRRKPMTTSLQLLLDEKDMEEDLKMINKSKLINVKKIWVDKPVIQDNQFESTAAHRMIKAWNPSLLISPQKRDKGCCDCLLLGRCCEENDGKCMYDQRQHGGVLLGLATASFSPTAEPVSNDPRIENGKLYFDKKWFYKNQSVMIECKDGSRFNAELVVTSGDMIIVKRIPENTKVRITLAQLAHGKYLVKRRNN